SAPAGTIHCRAVSLTHDRNEWRAMFLLRSSCPTLGSVSASLVVDSAPARRRGWRAGDGADGEAERRRRGTVSLASQLLNRVLGGNTMPTNPSMPIVPIQEWGQAITTSLTGALMIILGVIPRIIGFAVIVVVGWFIASLVGRGLAGLLRLVDFNGLA